jgi:hypothetical protein
LGPAALDTSGQLKGFLDLLNAGPCAAYEQLKTEVMFGNTRMCHAVMSAFVNNKFDPSLVWQRDGNRFGAYPH